MDVLQTALPATPLLAHIQVLRAFAAFAVLVSHLRVIESKYAIDPVLPESCSLGYVGVDLFFVISGFIMARLSFGAGRGLSAAMAFAIARCGSDTSPVLGRLGFARGSLANSPRHGIQFQP